MPRRTSSAPLLTPLSPSPARRPARLALLTAALATALGGLATAVTAPADAVSPAPSTAAVSTAAVTTALKAGNPVTPGTFTGYGFDQCLAPTQAAMDAWLTSSPYRAVGIYTSGASRGCRSQPNLTPTWVATQLSKGWKLLPITLGPQAPCNPSFPRYGDDPVISAKVATSGLYQQATRQGVAEAQGAVAAAQALGIVPGSTLWYDLEGYDNSNTSCRESSLAFLSAWTQQLHAQGYVSGVYSSAGSGIKALDDARVTRPGTFTLPDQIWIARWDGVANTSTTYIRDDGWRPGGRVKQYKGGHQETWGGVTINIDSNYLELGTVTANGGTAPAPPPEPSRCNGTPVDLANYPRLKAPAGAKKPDPGQVGALKCLLKQQGLFKGKTKGVWTERLTTSVNKWQKRVGLKRSAMFSRSAWMTLLAAGSTPSLGQGATGEDVRRVQRTLNAASPAYGLSVNGTFDAATTGALQAWQTRRGIAATGTTGPDTWAALQAGKR